MVISSVGHRFTHMITRIDARWARRHALPRGDRVGSFVGTASNPPRRRRALLGRAGGADLRLCPELPRSAAAVDPGQADPGLAARHRRTARPDRRALFRLLLLLHRHSGRLVRRPHQPRDRAVARLRDLERGDDGLRPREHLSAARRRAHDGRLRRGGRRAAVLRAHHRHFSARASAGRRSASTISAPPIGAALGIAFGASIAAAFDWRDAFIAIGVVGMVTAAAVRLVVREPVRGRFDVERRARREGGLRRDAARCSSRARRSCSPRSAAARRSSSPTAWATSRRCS